jgi:hypothetical protein
MHCEDDFGDDPVGAFQGLLHLTSIKILGIQECNMTWEPVFHLKPGNWPHLQQLTLESLDLAWMR